jgi:hypothetical protein
MLLLLLLLLLLLQASSLKRKQGCVWLLLLPLGESCVKKTESTTSEGAECTHARTHEKQQGNERQRLADDEHHDVSAGQHVTKTKTMKIKKKLKRH